MFVENKNKRYSFLKNQSQKAKIDLIFALQFS